MSTVLREVFLWLPDIAVTPAVADELLPNGTVGLPSRASMQQEDAILTSQPRLVAILIGLVPMEFRLDLYSRLPYNCIQFRLTCPEESDMPETKNDARLNFRINSELKKTIEDAAAQTGQTVSDFAVSTLIQVSRKILMDEQVTQLTERDRQLFAEMLDDESTKPNTTLVKAAKQYKKQVG